MGFIELPTRIENYYQSKLGHAWVEEDVWVEEFNEKFKGKMDEFDKLPKRNFLVFFTTEIENQQPDGWDQLMMVIGVVKKSEEYGTYIKINSLYRYGFAVAQLNTLTDITKELEDYFPEGLDHLQVAKDENLYYTYVGWVDSFPVLATEVVHAMKGVSEFQ